MPIKLIIYIYISSLLKKRRLNFYKKFEHTINRASYLVGPLYVENNFSNLNVP